MSLALALTLTGASRSARRGRPGRARPRRAGAGAAPGPASGDPAEARTTRRGARGLPAAAGGVPARGRRAVGSAAVVHPRRAAGLPRRARSRRERLAARGGAARIDRPGAGRDPGPPQPRLGRRAARATCPTALATGYDGSRPSTARTACRWHCCSWIAARSCCRPGWPRRRARTPRPRSPSSTPPASTPTWPRRACSPRRPTCSPATPRPRAVRPTAPITRFTRQHARQGRVGRAAAARAAWLERSEPRRRTVRRGAVPMRRRRERPAAGAA